MRNAVISIALLCTVALASGCVGEDLSIVPEQDTPDRTHFQLAVESYDTNAATRASEPSPNPEPESPEEKAIHDFWLFQFNPDGSQLAAPKYYELTGTQTLNNLTSQAFNDLTKNHKMTVFIVTNTGSANWVTGTDFNTLDKVKGQKLPNPFYILAGEDSDNDGKADDIFIPMCGQIDGITVTAESFVIVPVTRMFAKVKIQVSFKEESMVLYNANITGIPWYCKVGPLSEGLDAGGEPNAVPFPAGTRIISRALKSTQAIEDKDGCKWLTVYMPENIRGEIADADKLTKTNIPENALTVSIQAKYDGMDFYHTVYPGENSVNNFNVRRNCVYRVTLDVRSTEDQHNPSSNCYIVKPGDKLSFEPYNRVEKGGGYDISAYLDPNVTSKKIAWVGIIWQTKDCIGDNTGGKLVKLGPVTPDPRNQKIIIEKTGLEGNALIGAYNSNDEIIWSWHIWVTPNEPDNIANAITYTTYRWDSGGIYTNEPRVPGYGIMPCNLGALANTAVADPNIRFGMPYSTNHPKYPDSQTRTFGMLYQWGRKDPFPPMIYSPGNEDGNGDLPYTNNYTETHYENDNQTVVNKTSSVGDHLSRNYLFYSKDYFELFRKSAVVYSIQHPTVYIAHKNSDWCPDNQKDDKLWGGLEPDPNSMKKLKVTDKGKYNQTVSANLYDNYGTKSIFDPCPTGWRVPPGDIWLGFTKDGLNPQNTNGYNSFETVNFSETESKDKLGLSMYMRAWRNGPTSFFPLPGTRVGNGECINVGLCGNYHNATCSDKGRVNILHIHRDMSKVSEDYQDMVLFKLFELTTEQYYCKSTAGPIRCVRDSK